MFEDERTRTSSTVVSEPSSNKPFNSSIVISSSEGTARCAKIDELIACDLGSICTRPEQKCRTKKTTVRSGLIMATKASSVTQLE